MKEVTDLRVSCTACAHDVPLSEAMVSEAADYVAYFCGLDCYAAWMTRAAYSYPVVK